MAKTHVIKDDSLGGIEREYVEVERKAEVGEKILTVRYVGEKTKPGDILECTEASYDDGSITAGQGNYAAFFDTADRDEYRVLEPTDIVHIKQEGEGVPSGTRSRFRMVDRTARVGERVIVTDDWYDDKSGTILSIIDGSDFGFSADSEINDVFYEHPDNNIGQLRYISGNYYRVLVPVDSELAPQSQDDIIANLVRRMAQLESELTGAKRDIETWSREVEALKHEATHRAISEMEPKQITLDVDTFMKIIGGAR